MNPVTVFFVLLAVTKTTEGAWEDVPDPEKAEISESIFNAGVLTKPEPTSPAVIIPLRENTLTKGDKKSVQLIVAELEFGGDVYLFSAVLIYKKVVAHGDIRLIGNRQKVRAEILRTESDVQDYSKKFLVLSKDFKHTPGELIPKAIHSFGREFVVEFFFKAETGKDVGIYHNSSENIFCVGVPKVVEGKPTTFGYKGPHFKTLVEAFFDYEKYVNSRKALLVDPWVEMEQLSRTIQQRVELLKGELSTDFQFVCAKTVSEEKKHLMVIFREKESGTYYTYAAVPIGSSVRMKATFIGKTMQLNVAKREITDYFTLAFTQYFQNPAHQWIWAFEIYFVGDWAKIAPLTKEDLEKLQAKILEHSPYPIPDGVPVLLQKLCRGENVPGQWIVVCGCMEKLFWVTFVKTGNEITLTWSLPLGTDKETHLSLEGYHENLPSCLPNTSFEFGMNTLPQLPEAISSRMGKLFAMIKPKLPEGFKDVTLEAGLIDQGLIRVAPVPYGKRIGGKKVGPYLCCIGLKFTGDEILFVIVYLTPDGSIHSAEIGNPGIPTKRDEAMAGLISHLRSDNLTSLNTPRTISKKVKAQSTN